MDYLASFESSTDGATSARSVHPVDLVIDAFKDPDTAALTVDKLHTFLQESLKVHGKKFDVAGSPVPELVD